MTGTTVTERYIANAIEHGEYMDTGDHRRSNRAHDRLAKDVAELRKLPDRGEQIFLALLDHPSHFVRIWAATDLLHLKNDAAAIPILEKLTTHRAGWTGHNAKITLEEWHKGRLKVR